MLNPPPLPEGKVTLIGGNVAKLDGVREKLTVRPFGHSKKMTFDFDERTHIYVDGRETTYANIRRGDRVYVDSLLIGPQVFARNIRVVTQSRAAHAGGQVLAYDPGSGAMRLEDKLSAAPINVSIGPETTILLRNGNRGSKNDLQADSLVTVDFYPGRRNQASKIEVIAVPGERFTFAGKITNIDLRNGAIAVDNISDGNIYEIQAPPVTVDGAQLTIGKNVTVVATFTGTGYRADDVKTEAEGQSTSD